LQETQDNHLPLIQLPHLVVELVVNVTVLVELVALVVELVVVVVQVLLVARRLLDKALLEDLILRERHTLELVAVELVA
jgi:hypothetical protein